MTPGNFRSAAVSLPLARVPGDEDRGGEGIVHVAGDEVVRQGQIAESEAAGIDGGDGECGGRAVTEMQFQHAAGVQPQSFGGEFADCDGAGPGGEPGERTAGHLRVPGTGEAGLGDALSRELVEADPDRGPYDLGDGRDTGSRAYGLGGGGRDSGALRGKDPGGAAAFPGLGTGGVPERGRDEENRAGHADEQGQRGDDGGHPGGVSTDVRGGEGAA